MKSFCSRSLAIFLVLLHHTHSQLLHTFPTAVEEKAQMLCQLLLLRIDITQLFSQSAGPPPMKWHNPRGSSSTERCSRPASPFISVTSSFMRTMWDRITVVFLPAVWAPCESSSRMFCTALSSFAVPSAPRFFSRSRRMFSCCNRACRSDSIASFNSRCASSSCCCCCSGRRC